MVFKINIGTKDGKTYKLEADTRTLEGRELHQIVKGTEISPELEEYEFATISDHIIRRCVDTIKFFCNLAILSGCDVDAVQIARRFQLVKQLIKVKEEDF